MRKEQYYTHALAKCQDCDWYLEGVDHSEAIKHAQEHNHFVKVESGIVTHYNEKRGFTTLPLK